ncbi:MAG: hypothetical protein ACRC9Q_05545, partial [Bacteroidales bacterium]
MKLSCFMLICILLLGYSAKILAQKLDSGQKINRLTDANSEVTGIAPEIYSFNERVLLWENLFGENRQEITIAEFVSGVRAAIAGEELTQLEEYAKTHTWNWEVTNPTIVWKFDPSDRLLRKDFVRALQTPFNLLGDHSSMYDWTLNNNNPFNRQSARMNLINFPRLYFLVQMFSFFQVVDELIKQVPTSFSLNKQWKVS